MSEGDIIHLSQGTLMMAAVVLGCLALLFGVLTFRRLRPGGEARTPEHGWYVPVVDSHAIGDSFFHSWDVRFKCVSLFMYSMCVAVLNRPAVAGLALAFSFFTLFVGRISIAKAMKRLYAMAGFLSMYLLIMPLTAVRHPGDTLVMLDPTTLIFNVRGFFLALTLVFKAAAIALIMEPLFNTASLSVTVNGLQRLGVPSKVCQMLLMAHRYIFVFLHEAKRMSIGMRVRGFRKRSNIETMRVLGGFVGMLLLRSVDRTERVYQAMLARGFRGEFPVFHEYKSNSSDWAKSWAWGLLGVAFIVFDRYGSF